jgi:hypothetical protein
MEHPTSNPESDARDRARQAAIRKVQHYFAQLDNGRSMSQELLRDRKAEAEREKRK